MIHEPNRVTAGDVRERMKSPGGLLLVCAYDDEEKCRALGMSGLMSLQELRSKLASLPREQEIVFACS